MQSEMSSTGTLTTFGYFFISSRFVEPFATHTFLPFKSLIRLAFESVRTSTFWPARKYSEVKLIWVQRVQLIVMTSATMSTSPFRSAGMRWA